jgi:hypothetical protein
MHVTCSARFVVADRRWSTKQEEILESQQDSMQREIDEPDGREDGARSKEENTKNNSIDHTIDINTYSY